jgi:hypothetical protein
MHTHAFEVSLVSTTQTVAMFLLLAALALILIVLALGVTYAIPFIAGLVLGRYA